MVEGGSEWRIDPVMETYLSMMGAATSGLGSTEGPRIGELADQSWVKSSDRAENEEFVGEGGEELAQATQPKSKQAEQAARRGKGMQTKKKRRRRSSAVGRRCQTVWRG